jgi:hypothetical protein
VILSEKLIIMDVSKELQRSTQGNKTSIVPSMTGLKKENLIIGKNHI